MTEQELQNYEADADGNCANCMYLIAEVRRLRGLVMEVDKHPCDGGDRCPWCRFAGDTPADRGHYLDCPAFTPEGQVK